MTNAKKVTIMIFLPEIKRNVNLMQLGYFIDVFIA
jgi:hypothetical protein